MKRQIFALLGLLLSTLLLPLSAPGVDNAAESGRWTPERAWKWYSSQPWLVGFNYIPATAINTTEMWQADTFDPKTIDAELALAQAAGFNSARVFLPFLVWEQEPAGLKQRLEQFLAIAHKRGVRTLFVLFDDCAFGTMTEPFLGKQPDVNPGEYANGWTPSPGPKRVQDRAAWPKLEAYVKDVLGGFQRDERVLAWELYNEPGRSLPLVEAAFLWARQAAPTQPITTTVWGSPEMQRRILELSDVVSFHNYGPAPSLESQIVQLRAHGRPLLCTEWLNRPQGSVAETCLPVLARQRVGAFHWGLVNGKTQTHFPWGSKAGAAEPKVWQHDIFRRDRTPYDAKELAFFQESIRKGPATAVAVAGQWPADQAWAWHSAQPWLVGCNFLPSTAVNDVEMWQPDTFDLPTIERELGWAQALGFNTVRVFLNYVVWAADADGFKRRFEQFLAVADKHGIRTMPILLDDCNFSNRVAAVGRQPDPVPGVHNSQWVSSPPLKMVDDQAAWPQLKRYTQDLIGTHARDRRVVVWDLYNEPGSERSRPLMEAVFAWARELKPSQPLTVAAWADFNNPFQRRMLELSDVSSFHGYDGLSGVAAKLKICHSYARPVLCTEWMARGMGCRFETHLPVFKKDRIGCYNWGLVAGRTQTYFPWGSPQGAPEPNLWHHDILRADGRPFRTREVEFIKVQTGKLAASDLPPRKMLVPTAEQAPVPWRYVLEKPADNWFQPEFNDAAWKSGAAPFGTEEPPFARKPNTVWTSADVWIRREFDMPAGQFNELSLLLHHDEDTQVYINGVLAVKADGYNAAYEPFEIAPAACAALRPGKNIFAVHCHQTAGGQYLDLGLEAAVPKEGAAAPTTSGAAARAR